MDVRVGPAAGLPVQHGRLVRSPRPVGMHGVPDLYRSPYSIQDLKKLVRSIKTSGEIENAFIYFNNDIDASAIQNAKEMLALV